MSITYLTMADVVALHRRQLELYGGAPGVRDVGLIDSALSRPRNGFYSDLIEQAAALWESLAMNHGFVDGNKRIAFASTYTFLRLNGVVIEAEENEIADFVLSSLQKDTLNKSNLESWLRSHTREV